MKRIIVLLVLLATMLAGNEIKACDKATVSIASIVDNANGTYTVTYNMCVEFNGLEGSPYGWTFNYNNPNTIVVLSFSPATITSGGGNVYTGAIRDGNTDAQGDNVYGANDGINNLLQYYFPGFIPTNLTSTLCFTVTMTIQGYPTSVDIVTNIDQTTYSSCTKTVNFPPLPVCAVSGITAGTQTVCVPASNTYTQEVTVTYSNPPATGTLDVNGQSFAITSSPQTVVLVGLPADGNPVDVVAFFSDLASCNDTVTALFTAPPSCTSGCNPNNGTWD